MNHADAPLDPPPATGQGGFSLLEVLVALLVFTLAILAVTTLQTNAKRSSFEAVQRSTANFLAHDIIERMRANPGKLADYLTSGLGGSSIGAEPSPNCSASASPCTPAQMAAHDLWEWEQAIDGAAEQSAGGSTGGLVSPTGCITSDAAGASGNYVVAIAWKGKEALSNPTSSDCGSGTGNYGASNEYRRIVTMSTYLASE